MKGNCDISAISHYLKNSGITCVEELPYASRYNNHHMGNDNLWYIRQIKELSLKLKDLLINKYYFIDKYLYKSKLYKDLYDVAVFSVLNDYLAPLYQDKETNIIFPVVPVNGINILDENLDNTVNLYKKYHVKGVTKSVLETLHNDVNCIGYNSEKAFRENLEFLYSVMNKPIIFINGSEIPHPDDTADVNDRFILLNKVLDDFVNSHENCYLADVRKYVNTAEDMADVKTHYRRHVYIALANDIKTIAEKIRTEKNLIKRFIHYLKSMISIFFYDLKNKSFSFTDLRYFFIRIRLRKDEQIIRIMGIYLLNRKEPTNYNN